jgi:hypothetical protein
MMTSMNVFNHPNLGSPNTGLISPSVGTITSLTNYGGLGSSSNNRGMRQVMLGVRIEILAAMVRTLRCGGELQSAAAV